MEIFSIFYSGYLDYRGAASFIFFIVAALVTEVLFVQFLLCNSLSTADRCIMDASLSNDY